MVMGRIFSSRNNRIFLAQHEPGPARKMLTSIFSQNKPAPAISQTNRLGLVLLTAGTTVGCLAVARSYFLII
jgi:hypothetical protein